MLENAGPWVILATVGGCRWGSATLMGGEEAVKLVQPQPGLAANGRCQALRSTH